MPVFYRGIFDFLGGGVGAIRAIGVIGAIGRVTAVRTHGRASVPVKNLGAVTFDTTDAQIVRPYKGLHVNEGYSSRFDTTDALPLDTFVHLYRGASRFST